MNLNLIIGLILALVGAYGFGHHAGYVEKETEDKLEIARLNGVMTKQKEEQDVKDAETKQVFEDKLAATIASRPRLFVPITSSGCSTSAANNGQARAELDGQTVEDLIRLVAEGDRAIIDLNSCIDRYNALKDTVNGQR
jgi:hypothetical protein